MDISEHLVCVAKEHASWHKHFARNKFDSAKRTFAATAAYVDSDACSFKRTQNGFIAFCVDNLVAYFEFENLCCSILAANSVRFECLGVCRTSRGGYRDKEEILFGLDNLVVAIEQKDCDGARNQIETIFKNGIEDINKHCIDYSVY